EEPSPDAEGNATVLRSAGLLGESDEKPFGPTDGAEASRVFTIGCFADELRAARAGFGEPSSLILLARAARSKFPAGIRASQTVPPPFRVVLVNQKAQNPPMLPQRHSRDFFASAPIL